MRWVSAFMVSSESASARRVLKINAAAPAPARTVLEEAKLLPHEGAIGGKGVAAPPLGRGGGIGKKKMIDEFGRIEGRGIDAVGVHAAGKNRERPARPPPHPLPAIDRTALLRRRH